MTCLRVRLAIFLALSLPFADGSFAGGRNSPMGFLAQAYRAHLNTDVAFAGLSLYDGEQLSTQAEGAVLARVGNTSLVLAQNTTATLHEVVRGAHIDLDSGALSFSSAEDAIIEVHAGEALLRPYFHQLTGAEITIVAPKILQVAALRGDLSFSYGREFQVLPEGEVYRIYLESPAEPVDTPGSPTGAAEPAVRLHKVSYFVVGGAAVVFSAWGIHELAKGGHPPISPAKPRK